jgi:hypothetical protein
MFTEPKVNVIRSDEGYEIEVHGMRGMEYREGIASVFFDAEVGGSGEITSIGIWKDSIQFRSFPKQSEPITEEERIKILKRVCAALKWKKTPVEIHSKATGWVSGWLE